MNETTATRERLLFHLRENKGDWVSGEGLSDRLSVTRSAVWKHIRKLREEGYLIESSPKRGYRLQKASQMLLPQEIREGLETEVFGRGEIFHFTEIDSTNRKAGELAARGAPEGTLVISEAQSRGRGRMGREWFSPPGKGIYASLILRPPIAPSEAPGITLLTAVAVTDSLAALTRLKPAIKWPNDILIGGKKVAGILTEIRMEMDAVDYMVVGLGLNVNVKSFPDPIRETATSISRETGGVFSRVALLREYLRHFEDHYNAFRRGGLHGILKRWRKLSDTIGRRIRVVTLGGEYVGKAEDIDREGFLILKDGSGPPRRIFSGDVMYL
ncbi:MAG: biotin--[acetyl-CoA-carboxylase] ligase [Deltaproteobacteria bacterium]|nr:biotin--[acetyl-CoA-carboxylase] ligase [Deltaproteobacteria bacterium]